MSGLLVTCDAFRRTLLALWNSTEERDIAPGFVDEHGRRDYAAWSGATKDLLIALGARWDEDAQDYVFDGRQG